MSKNSILLLAVAALLCLSPRARADEPIRAVQEELRKRNLYFGDVDGRQTPGFVEALKKYQARKGFAVTGQTDTDTLLSMGIAAPATTAAALPDVPVLRSDRNMATDRTAASAPPIAQPAPPPNAPAPTRAEMIAWLRRYLEACQTPDSNDELGYYGEWVDYFHHGTVTKGDIGRELASYAQLWPTRRYWISGPVKATQADGKTVVRARINFELEGGLGRQARGKVDNAFTLARRADLKWEIVGHEEERVRQSTRRRSSSKRRRDAHLTPLDRTLKKFFGPAPKRSKR